MLIQSLAKLERNRLPSNYIDDLAQQQRQQQLLLVRLDFERPQFAITSFMAVTNRAKLEPLWDQAVHSSIMEAWKIATCSVDDPNGKQTGARFK